MVRTIYIALLFPCLVFSQGKWENLWLASQHQAAHPYTPGTNLLPDMAGNKDSPESNAQITGGWTSSGANVDLENTIVRSGTTAIRVFGGSASNDDVIAFGWDPPGQAAGKKWRWEGYVYVPSASASATLSLEIGDTGGSSTFNIDESLTDQWVFFSLDFEQTTINTFRTMEFKGNGTFYVDDMHYLDITP